MPPGTDNEREAPPEATTPERDAIDRLCDLLIKIAEVSPQPDAVAISHGDYLRLKQRVKQRNPANNISHFWGIQVITVGSQNHLLRIVDGHKASGKLLATVGEAKDWLIDAKANSMPTD